MGLIAGIWRFIKAMNVVRSTRRAGIPINESQMIIKILTIKIIFIEMWISVLLTKEDTVPLMTGRKELRYLITREILKVLSEIVPS